MPDPRQDLDSLLDAEHQALLSGNYTALTALSSRKFEMFASDSFLADLVSSEALRRKLDRNQTLLAMAISGFRAARRDIEAIEGQRDGFETYDRKGSRNRVGGSQRGFERKV